MIIHNVILICTPSPDAILAIVSIVLACVSILATTGIGTIAVLQAYHYYKMSKKSNDNIELLTRNINEAVTELKAVNTILTDSITKILGKAVTQLGKSGTSDNIKKDIVKAVTDSSGELTGKIKHVTETLDRQGKESQVGIDDLKAQVMLISDGMQKLFKIVMKQFEPEITEEGLRNHILEKISKVTDTLSFCSFKDLIQVISHQEISYDKIISEIRKMKEEGIIVYDGEELFEETKITIVKKI